MYQKLTFSIFFGLSLLQPLCADPPTPFRVTLLGTIGGPKIDPDRYGASLIVEAGGETLLFDCGRGVSQRLAQSGRTTVEIDKVFLTHMHSDHIVGLPDLWLSGSVGSGRPPLRVWGPEGTVAMAAGLESAYQTEILTRRVWRVRNFSTAKIFSTVRCWVVFESKIPFHKSEELELAPQSGRASNFCDAPPPSAIRTAFLRFRSFTLMPSRGATVATCQNAGPA